MATSLPQTMPGSPISNTASPSSVDSPTLPRTPDTLASSLPELPPVGADQLNGSNAQAVAAAAAAAAAKRKPSRRANTAERRATHNAVERQRRETLNGRFLDLAGLLPNLSQIRRPSKSAIVNSSIAHVHASRRHRMLAARELRLLKMEADALRREINQWRDRAGVPCMDEPLRSDAFAIVLAGELEIEPDLLMLEGAGYGDDGDMYDDGEDGDYFGAPMAPQPPMGPHGMPGVPMMNGGMLVSPGAAAAAAAEEHALFMKQAAAAAAAQGNPFSHSVPPNARPALHIRPPSHPQHAAAAAMLTSPLAGGFGGPAELGAYEPHRLNPYGHPAHAAPHAPHFAHSPTGGAFDAGVEHKWGVQQHLGGLAAAAQQQGMFTPPASAHGERGTAAAFGGIMQQRMLQGQGHSFGSPVDGDDGASVGSAPGRPRSGSAASVGARSSVSGSFDVPAEFAAAGMAQRMRERGLSVSTGVGSWPGEQGMAASPMGGMGMQGGMKTSPIQIPVGSGGGVGMGMNAAFAMML